MKRTLSKAVTLAVAMAALACLLLPVHGALAAGIISGPSSEIDDSQGSLGIVKVRYTGGDGAKLKVQVLNGDGKSVATYDLRNDGVFDTFSITAGAGTYVIRVARNIQGISYSIIQSVTITVMSGGTATATAAPSAGPTTTTAPTTTSDLMNNPSFAPYLVSNSTVSFNSNSKAVAKAAELCASAKSDLDKVSAVYKYITDNFTYDYDKMGAIQRKEITSYTPNVDTILAAKKGICFDYAALLAAMLRSQGVPTKLIKGNATVQGQTFYHAWNEVYIQGVGWVKVSGSFYFDGKVYTPMDPTYSAADKKYEFKSANYKKTSEY